MIIHQGALYTTTTTLPPHPPPQQTHTHTHTHTGPTQYRQPIAKEQQDTNINQSEKFNYF
jgi:hypothetical protein